MWTYIITTGELLQPSGTVLGVGYSGHGEGKNNPELQQMVGVGPICEGHYAIGKPFDSEKTGVFAMRLSPMPGTEVYGRADFELHGDSAEHPGQASHGCIALSPKALRQAVAQSGDIELRVVRERKDVTP